MAHLSWGGGFAVETLGTGDAPPVTFVLCGGVVTDAVLVEPQPTRHTLYTLQGVGRGGGGRKTGEIME